MTLRMPGFMFPLGDTDGDIYWTALGTPAENKTK